MTTKLAPEDAVAAAQACANTGRLHEAQFILAGVLEDDPRHGAARALAGLLAYLNGDLETAESHLAIAVESAPLHFDARYVRAFTLAGLGRLEDAVAGFRRVLSLDPGCTPARIELAQILVELGRRDEAVCSLEAGRGAGLAPEDIEVALREIETGASASVANADPPLAYEPDDAYPFDMEEERVGLAPAVIDMAPNVTWVDPRDLLHAGRMDVAVKWLYARALLGEASLHSGYAAEDAYLRHILFRTGGAEPGDEGRKGSLASFTHQFARLVASMKERGFDPAEPIPVAQRTGLILNGAHRLAAALALGLERVPVVQDDGPNGLTWDYDELVDQAFAPIELDEIARAWIALQRERAGIITLWSPVEVRWDEIEDEIAAKVPIALRRDVELEPHAFAELVRDLYTTDWGPVVGENIERKVAFLAHYAPRLRFLVVRTAGTESPLAALKCDIRDRWSHVVPADRFATLHTTETAGETAHVADLLLSHASLYALRRRPAGGLRPEFLSWLGAYHAALRERRIDPEECCVVGSAVLEALGVRAATDLDFTVTGAVRASHFTPGVTHVTDTLDVVAQNYPRAIARAAAPGDDDLVRDRARHFRVRGLKFASLDVVLERKQTQRRRKDLEDVARVGRMRADGRL